MPKPRAASGRRRGLPAAWLGLLLLSLSGCDTAPPRVQETLLVWDTEAQIEVLGLPVDQAEAAIAAAAQAMGSLATEWHAWKPSALTRINQQFARGEPAPAPDSVLALIERSRPILRKTRGLFDPGVGGLIDLWGFHTDQYPIQSPEPDRATLAAWLAARPSLLDVEQQGQQLRSRNPHVQLDFGAIGEGAAIEYALKALREHGVKNALIALGGDVVALGSAGTRPWRVGLEDPVVGQHAQLAQVELGDGEGLFVSGNYARFRYSASGERWGHVLDPRTARPTSGVALTAVIGRDPLLADAASTALMIAGPAEFSALLHRLDLHCALLLTDQNELMLTAAMARRLHLLRQPVALGPPLGHASGC